MKNEPASIWERIFIRIKNVVDRFLYFDNLFDDNVWQVRFSKSSKRKLKYKIEQERFSLQLKTGDDVFKYLWMLLLAGSLVEVVVEQFGILILRHFAVRNANALAQQQHAHQGSG